MVVPIVREKAKLDSRITSTRDPSSNLTRDIMRSTRNNRIIYIEQHGIQPTLNQISLDIDMGRAGKIPIRVKKSHAPPPKSLARIHAGNASTAQPNSQNFFQNNSKSTDRSTPKIHPTADYATRNPAPTAQEFYRQNLVNPIGGIQHIANI
jgi:hypothetical protein